MPGEIARPVGLAGSGPLARIAQQRLAHAAIADRVVRHAGDAGAWPDCDVLVTAFPDPGQLRHFVDAVGREAAGSGRTLHLLDLTPMSPSAMRELSGRCRGAGIVACGASLPAAGLPGGGATLYVDQDALAVPSLAGVLEALAETIVPTGPAGTSKAVATVVELIVAVNSAAVREAFALAASAGIDAVALSPLLEKGSGASAVAARAAGPSVHDVAPAASPLHLLRRMLVDAIGVAREVDHPAFFAALGIASLGSASTARLRDAPAQALAAAAAPVRA
jgi:3-hydroxyisobutyrate dehydrogenase-like beta-hydroxyacid dehydrogenase